MFDISWGEMMVIGVVALVVIGPKELPGVIRAVGKGMGKLRTMATEFRGQFDEAMREAELHEVKKAADDFKATATGLATSTFDPIRNQLNEAVEVAKGKATEATGLDEVNKTVAAIEADAKALEAEANITAQITPVEQPPVVIAEAPAAATVEAAPVVEPEPEPAPKPRRKKADTGDAA
jgi:sec-independent protein translocase protein TatB